MSKDVENKIKRVLVFSEVRKQSEKIAAALRELFSHLPADELDDDEEIRFGLDESKKRFAIIRGADMYWLEYGYVARERAGQMTYFKSGQAFSSPPPSDN